MKGNDLVREKRDQEVRKDVGIDHVVRKNSLNVMKEENVEKSHVKEKDAVKVDQNPERSK